MIVVIKNDSVEKIMLQRDMGEHIFICNCGYNVSIFAMEGPDVKFDNGATVRDWEDQSITFDDYRFFVAICKYMFWFDKCAQTFDMIGGICL